MIGHYNDSFNCKIMMEDDLTHNEINSFTNTPQNLIKWEKFTLPEFKNFKFGCVKQKLQVNKYNQSRKTYIY